MDQPSDTPDTHRGDASDAPHPHRGDPSDAPTPDAPASADSAHDAPPTSSFPIDLASDSPESDPPALPPYPDPADERDAYPAAFLARYEPLQQLSQGALSETLIVRARADGRYGVAKCAHRASPRPIGEEIPLTLPPHPSLPEYLDRFEDARRTVVVRAYVEGASLEEAVVRGTMTPRLALLVVDQLLDVLAFLHESTPPIIHRDIKPQNVILTANETIALIDFETARYYAEGAAHDSIALGTRAFAAPEQFGYQQTDARADIYSLGVLLRYLLTGNAAHDAANVAGRSVSRFIARCTAFSPDDRYPTARITRRALRRVRFVERYARRAIAVATIACALALGWVAGRWGSGMVAARNVDGNGAGPYAPATTDGGPSGAPNGASSDANGDSSHAGGDAFASLAPLPATHTIAPTPTQVPTPVPLATFREPLIEQAARMALGLGDDDNFYVTDLPRIQALRICLDTTYSDDDAFFIDYDRFKMMYRQGNALPPQGPVQSLNDLRGMTGMRSLRICAQPLSDLSALAGLTHLETLDLSFTDSSDLTPLANLSSMGMLDLSNTRVTDLTPLAKLPLKDLFLNDIGADLTPLQGHAFDTLGLSGNREALQALHGCSVRFLMSNGQGIGSLDVFQGIEGIEELHIMDNMATSVEPLAQITTVRHLKLGVSSTTKDLASLTALPNLETLELLEKLRDIAKTLPPDPPFEVIFVPE